MRLLVFLLLFTLVWCSNNNDKSSDQGTQKNDTFEESYDQPSQDDATNFEVLPHDTTTIDDVSDFKDMPLVNNCSLSGRVIDDSGNPLSDIVLVLCVHTNCFFNKTDESGNFVYENIKNQNGALKVVGKMKGKISLSIPISGCSGKEAVDVGNIVLIPLEDGEKVSAKNGGKVKTGDLTLTLPPDIKFPNFEEEATIIATTIPIDILHPWLTTEISPVKVYTFDPYGTELSSKCDIIFQLNDLKNSSVALFYVDYLTGEWIKFYQGTVGEDGTLSVLGKGPETLTMIAVTKGQ